MHKQLLIVFVQKSVLFFAPLLLFIVLVEAALWRSGESWPAARVAKAQYHSSQHTLYSRAFLSQQMNLYKQAGIRLRSPDILALGSSRVMQFRESLFAPVESSFYNAGGMIQEVPDLSEYVRRVASKEISAPQTVLVGVDPWWFNPEYGRTESWLGEEDAAATSCGHMEAVRLALKKKAMGKVFKCLWIPMKTPFFGHRAYGLQAVFKGDGFRRDGSLQPSPQWVIDYVENPVYYDRESNPILGRISRLAGKFSAVNGPDRSKGDDLISCFEEMRSLGIEVIVLFPPFSTEVLTELNRNEALKEWWSYYTNDLVEMIRERGFTCHVFISPETLGLDDRYMLDGFHPGEVFVGHMLKNILMDCGQQSTLSTVDRNHLQKILDAAALPLSFDGLRMMKK